MSEFRSGRGSGSVPTGTGKRVPSKVSYAFVGGVAGFIIGLVALFVLAASYGSAMGLSVGACAAAGCTLTVLFSQPAGIAGMAVGAIVGALIGRGVYHRRR